MNLSSKIEENSKFIIGNYKEFYGYRLINHYSQFSLPQSSMKFFQCFEYCAQKSECVGVTMHKSETWCHLYKSITYLEEEAQSTLF